MALDIDEILHKAVQRKASDVHITAGLPPVLRIDGRLVPMDEERIVPSSSQELVYSMLTDQQKQAFEENFERGISRWHLDEGWSVESDGEGHVLAGRGHSWAFPEIDLCYNYSIQFRLKLRRGGIHITFRNLNGSRYFLGMNREMIYLTKQVGDRFSELKVLRPGIGKMRWYKVGILLQGEHIRIYLDDRLRMSYTDSSNPLLAGLTKFKVFFSILLIESTPLG